MGSDQEDVPFLVSSPDQPDAPSYRPFRQMPTGSFVQRVADHIRETGQPETFVGLFRGRIDRTAKFRIIRNITIDRRKRPNRDMAPCPRCGCADKFLDGALAWFPDLQFCAVIGHCCADKEARNEAEREYKARKLLEQQETYLLVGLPLLGAKAELLKAMRSPAVEAQRVYRQFRKQAHAIHQHLRELKANRGGLLTVTEILRSGEEEEASDYFGPSGFSRPGQSSVRTVDHEFGVLNGQTAVMRDYNPVKELDEVVRYVNSFGMLPSEEEAVEFIVGLDAKRRRVAVAILQGVDRYFDKFSRHLSNFWGFFTRANAERLHAYGTHPGNAFQMEVRYLASGRRAGLLMRHNRVDCRLTFDETVATTTVPWTFVPFGEKEK